MTPDSSYERQHSWIRSGQYLVNRWLLRREFLQAQLPERNLRFKVKTEDVVGRHIYKYHVHEPAISSMLASRLSVSPGDVILDIGANIGWHSILLDRLSVSGADIFAFEPDPLNFELLNHNVAQNEASKVQTFQYAIAEKRDTMRLHRHNSNNLGRHSLIELQHGDSIDVQAITLDQFWTDQKLGSRNPAFMKIDVEGAELGVLLGAEQVLSKCPMVLCEFSPNYMKIGNINQMDLVTLLTDHGFKPHRIRDTEIHPMNPSDVNVQKDTIDLLWLKDGG